MEVDLQSCTAQQQPEGTSVSPGFGQLHCVTACAHCQAKAKKHPQNECCLTTSLAFIQMSRLVWSTKKGEILEEPQDFKTTRSLKFGWNGGDRRGKKQ